MKGIERHFIPITSRRNSLVRRLRDLATNQGRNESSSLLLEGTHLFKEALKTGSLPGEIIATSVWLEKHSNLLAELPDLVKVYEVTVNVLKAGLTTVSPDGVACIFPFSGLPRIKEKPNYVLALDRIQDPGNLGNLFRTAHAAEIDMLWIASGVDPLNQKVLRSSAGSVLHLAYERYGNAEKVAVQLLAERLNTAAELGYQVIATSKPNINNFELIIPYWELDWTKPTVLVLGNEGSGMHPLLEKSCTCTVTLPHSPLVESLNVASAAVPLLLERRRTKMDSNIRK